jgi:hypothetical protein
MNQTYIKTKDGIFLFCPAPWNERPWDELKKLANGCGPSGWKEKLVPDNILGCDISESCVIHDIQYLTGEDIAEKESADRSFLNNMVRTIRARTKTFLAKKLLLSPRLKLAWVYYQAVNRFGGSSYWDKNLPK